MLNLKIAAACVGCSIIVSAVTTAVMGKLQEQEPVKIAVIDYAKIVESIQPGAGEAERDAVMNRVQTQVRKLGAAGYLVLHSNAVLATPPSMQVPIPIAPASELE